MSDEQHIGNDKSRYLNAPKRTEVGHRSGLAGLKTAPRIKKKLFTLHKGRRLEAEHVIVPAQRVEKETLVHPANHEIKKPLQIILLEIFLSRLKKEGRYRRDRCKRDGVYLLIEGSRRRFCCIKAEKDLPCGYYRMN